MVEQRALATPAPAHTHEDSLGWILNVRARWITKLPQAIVRALIAMRGAGDGIVWLLLDRESPSRSVSTAQSLSEAMIQPRPVTTADVAAAPTAAALRPHCLPHPHVKSPLSQVVRSCV